MGAGPPVTIKPIAGRDVLIAVGIAVLVYVFAAQFLPLLRTEPMTGARQQVMLIAYLAINAAACGAAVATLLARNHGYSWSDLGIGPANQQWMRLGLGIGLAAVPLAFAAVIMIRQTLGLSSSDSNLFAPRGFSWLAAGTIILYAGLLVPILEELFFRGVIFGWLRSRFPAYAAIPISAGIFAVVHWRVDAMILAFVMGCLLAWLYERSRSLLPSILMHQAYNSTQLILLYGLLALAPERPA